MIFYESIEISKGTHRFNTKRIGECKIEVYPKEGFFIVEFILFTGI